MKYVPLLAMLALAGLSSCSEPTYPNAYSDQVIVQGYLMANQPIDSIIVRRTARLNEYVLGTSLAISGATVIITGNGIGDTLKQMAGFPGYYTSVRVPANIIRPRQTYTLSVQTPDGRTVTASTTVPDTFHILGKDNFPRTLHYKQGLYSIAWTPSNFYADYITAVASIDTSVIEPIPSEFNDQKPERTSYGFNYIDKTHTEIPWFTFNYYGKTALIIEAIDKNYYDFIRQINGGSTDIKEIRYNVNGGLGVFGSAALDSLHVVLVP